MAEGWAKHLKNNVLNAYSAGVEKHGMNEYAMRVMAGITRRFLTGNVFVMVLETLIIQDAIAAMTSIAKRVGKFTFGRVIHNAIIAG